MKVAMCEGLQPRIKLRAHRSIFKQGGLDTGRELKNCVNFTKSLAGH